MDIKADHEGPKTSLKWDVIPASSEAENNKHMNWIGASQKQSSAQAFSLSVLHIF